MQSFPLKLQYKGERNYIRGSDIYNAAMDIVQTMLDDQAWINHIVFRGFARNSCDLILEAPKDYSKKAIRAVCTIKHKEKLIPAIIVETNNKINERYGFDENIVLNEVVLQKKSIFQNRRAGFSAIEEIIVLTKHLHNKLIPIQQGRWIFSQLDLIEPFTINNEYCYSIELKQNLANRMTVSNIIEGDRHIGQIRFTVSSI